MAKSESEVQQLIQMEAMKVGSVLMRNNSGAFKAEDGRVVYFGLGNISKKHSENIKSSDLIGITTIVVTPDMVGKSIGVFTAIECKSEIWNSPKDKRAIAQQNFIDWVRARGGIAAICKSVDDFMRLFRP